MSSTPFEVKLRKPIEAGLIELMAPAGRSRANPCLPIPPLALPVTPESYVMAPVVASTAPLMPPGVMYCVRSLLMAMSPPHCTPSSRAVSWVVSTICASIRICGVGLSSSWIRSSMVCMFSSISRIIREREWVSTVTDPLGFPSLSRVRDGSIDLAIPAIWSPSLPVAPGFEYSILTTLVIRGATCSPSN